jgi:hypothetical protein
VRHAVSRATFGVEGDIRCRGRHSVSRATFGVEGDIRCRMRHAESGVGGPLSRATFGVAYDNQSRKRHCMSLSSGTVPSTQEAHTAHDNQYRPCQYELS